MSDLTSSIFVLKHAASPEEVFGDLAGTKEEKLAACKKSYHKLAQLHHEDHHGGSSTEAKEAFQLLQEWYHKALEKIEADTYGKEEEPEIVLYSEKESYAIGKVFRKGDLADLYLTDGKLVKVVQKPKNSDLMENEATMLTKLRDAVAKDPKQAKLLSQFPEVVDTFNVKDADINVRRVNVFRYDPDFYTLADVIAQHPKGLPLADAAWIFNRLLGILAITHQNGYVHGAVTPAHMMIRPLDHNGLLVDWCYSVKAGQMIKVVSVPCKHLYPPEVLSKQPATPGTDLFMAAKTIELLIGPAHNQPTRLRGFLRSLMIPNPARRPQDSWRVFGDYQELLTDLFGKRTFRPFAMPA